MGPNIFLIVLDTLRADRMSLYGYSKETTPNIDRFAQDSTVYTNAFSTATWTVPAHTSIFTGLYPISHKVTQENIKLNPNIKTAAEILKEKGYKTASFCNNPLVSLDNDVLRGFENRYTYSGMPGFMGKAVNKIMAESKALAKFLNKPFFVDMWGDGFKGNTRKTKRDLRRYLRKAQGPNFVFINLMDTHLPYRPPKRFVRRWLPYLDDVPAKEFILDFNRKKGYSWMLPYEKPMKWYEALALSDLYDAEVNYLDLQVKRILRIIKRFDKDAVIIVTSDHGHSDGYSGNLWDEFDSIGEIAEGYDSFIEKRFHGHMGHAFDPNHQVSWVPLIVNRASKKVNKNTSIKDILSMILGFAGYESENDKSDSVMVNAPPINMALATSDNDSVIKHFNLLSNRDALYSGRHKVKLVENEVEAVYDISHNEYENIKDKIGFELFSELTNEYSTLKTKHTSDIDVINSDSTAMAGRLKALGYMN